MQERPKTRATTRHAALFWIALLAIGGASLFASSAAATDRAGLQPTAASGESWLTHLGRSFDETSMGKTGRLGPAEMPPDLRQLHSQPQGDGETVVVRGSDLYRMNCRGCHGEDGTGAPPEINSVISPVRATSATAMIERMRDSGMEMSRADAEKLAVQSRMMLLERLHHGGHDMPAFPHLSEREIRALVAYLRELSGVRGAEKEQLAVRESRVRIGEHIVKATCHTCHSAAGPNPTAQQLYDGAIPPLSTLVERTTQEELVRKVTQGTPVMMGVPPQLLRGRMPVFYYLSDEEAADVYMYLTQYPPESYAALENWAEVQGRTADAGDGRATATMVARIATDGIEPERKPPAAMDSEVQMAAVPVMLGMLALVLLGLGFLFTVSEMKRLQARHETGTRQAKTRIEEARLEREAAA